MLRRLLILLVVFGAIVGTARSAQAGNYVVYLHGRSMNSWPLNATLGTTAAWSHITMSYNGSASLGDSTIRGSITNTIATYCGGGNQCVVVCYSAGCARMLDAYKLLKDQGRYPANILWSEAAGSAAGGSESAVFSTKWWVKLMAKIFNMDSAAPIDYDIQPNVMRSGAYANIQNQATTPVYHLAGSQNICATLKILFFIRVKLCGNSSFPGGYGDGVVPVHSSAGYADAGAHASTQDGSAKYVFRAYEQTPLYPVDHRSILGPLVSAGSLRLAVSKTANCPSMPAVTPDVPDASIIYDDGDGAFTEESSPLYMLAVCGNDMWDGTPALYATCQSVSGCCSSFSSGSAGGCTCGEGLCRQSKIARRSFYTGDGCTGTEYSETTGLNDFVSYDGLGMVGETTQSVTTRSARTWPSGLCQTLVRRVTWSGNCPETYPTSKTLSAARRVYRPAGAPPPPTGDGGELVVSSTNYPNSYCP
jgi:hypothetical protein